VSLEEQFQFKALFSMDGIASNIPYLEEAKYYRDCYSLLTIARRYQTQILLLDIDSDGMSCRIAPIFSNYSSHDHTTMEKEEVPKVEPRGMKQKQDDAIRENAEPLELSCMESMTMDVPEANNNNNLQLPLLEQHVEVPTKEECVVHETLFNTHAPLQVDSQNIMEKEIITPNVEESESKKRERLIQENMGVSLPSTKQPVFSKLVWQCIIRYTCNDEAC
jgi:hypothetical protein